MSKSGLPNREVESRWLSSYDGKLSNRADTLGRSVAYYLGPPSLERLRGPIFIAGRILVSFACRVKYPLFELMILQLLLASGNAL